MKDLVLLSVLQLWIGAAPAAPSGTGHAAHEHSLADGVLVRPRHGVDRLERGLSQKR
ncbi:MAG: hypothetical protein INR63_28320 [Actinomycetospora chiangmaiensis]|nr:hypothetical protein [Actinomycetospora chiangmaiensis]